MKGSLTVLIGTQGGLACSACPGGVSGGSSVNPLRVGSPVNPLLGAKVLDGADDLDVALPGALAFSWQRQYSSYANAETGMRCGLHGYGWTSPMDIELELEASRVRLFDARGRVITFDEALPVGGALYSESEDLWIMRGAAFGVGKKAAAGSIKTTSPNSAAANTDSASTNADSADSTPWHQQALWQHLPLALRCNPMLVFAASGAATRPGGAREVWLFGPPLSGTSGTEGIATLAADANGLALGRGVLYGLMDRFGRRQTHHRDAAGALAGITDGTGRRFDFVIAQNHAATTERNTPRGYQPDNGKRLIAITLARDPHAASYTQTRWAEPGDSRKQSDHPALGIMLDTEQRIVLARYHYNTSGDLVQVDRREGDAVRRFRYVHHLMTGHSHAGDAADSAARGAGGASALQEDSGVAGMLRADAGSERFAHQYIYDRLEPGGRVVEQHNAGELSYRFDYDQASSLGDDATVVTDSLGRIETYHFKGEGGLKRLTHHTLADGSQQRYQYDGAGRKVGELDPLGRATYYRIDPDGKLTGVQGPDGAQTQQSYAADGSKISFTNAEGHETHVSFDSYGRMTDAVAADGTRTQYQYPSPPAPVEQWSDPALPLYAPLRLTAELPHTIIDASGKPKKLHWTALGQLASYIDCSGKLTRYRYNAEGQLAETINPEQQTTRHRYNDRGLLAETRHPDQSYEQYHYDAAQRLTAVIPFASNGTRAGESVSVQRDAQGRITTRDHAGHTLGYRYDIAGRLISLTNENQATTQFRYSALDQLIEEIGFDGRTQQHRFDAAGQLIESSESNSTSAARSAATRTYRYEYDRAGRLSARYVPAVAAATASAAAPAAPADPAASAASVGSAAPFSSVQRFSYNKAGQLLSALEQALGGADSDTAAATATPLSAVRFERDAFGRIAGETQRLYSNINSSNGPSGKLEFEHTIAYRYDVLGALVSTELPAAMSAGRIDYQRYGSGHLHGIALDGNSLIDFERDHLHRENQRTLYGVNTAKGNTAQLRISRDLDVMGRLLTQQLEALSAVPEPRVGGAGSPSAGSIGSIEPEALTRHYRYNALGQLTEVRVAGLPQLARQLGRTQLGPHSPTLQQASTLHAAQRVLSGSVLQFDYDPLGRLIAATDPLDPEGALNRYRFDAAGNRLSSHPGSLRPPSSPQSPQNHRPESTATSGLQANTPTPTLAHTSAPTPTLAPTPASKRAAKASTQQAALLAAMQRADFNPLYGDAQRSDASADTERWADNRIKAFEHKRYQYDAFGNRIGSESLQSSDNLETLDARQGAALDTHSYSYDGLHQLSRIDRYRIEGGALKRHSTVYRYDALGRRMGKLSVDAKGETSHATYYGWEGDRLVHTETEHTIERTVYEPESFVPILKLTKSKAAPNAMALLVGMGDVTDEGSEGNEAGAQGSNAAAPAAPAPPPNPLSALPKSQQDEINAVLLAAMNDPEGTARAVAKVTGIGADTMTAFGISKTDQAEANEGMPSLADNLRALKTKHDAAQAKTPLQIHHIYCDHLGTPIALIAANGEHAGHVTWHGTYDAWGTLVSEYNPENINQPIRFQGQHFDQESGLHYNRFRYYDPHLGAYITQDPIGFSGGMNAFTYVGNPISAIDPLGLQGKTYSGNSHQRSVERGKDFRQWQTDEKTSAMGPKQAAAPGDKVDEQVNQKKSIFESLSPYDYSMGCRVFVVPNSSKQCQSSDEMPGMTMSRPGDRIPSGPVPIEKLPAGAKCLERVFMDQDKPLEPVTAGSDDWTEMGSKLMQRIRQNRTVVRK